MVNFVQITSVAISIDVDWSLALIGMFETAGNMQIHCSLFDMLSVQSFLEV